MAAVQAGPATWGLDATVLTAVGVGVAAAADRAALTAVRVDTSVAMSRIAALAVAQAWYSTAGTATRARTHAKMANPMLHQGYGIS